MSTQLQDIITCVERSRYGKTLLDELENMKSKVDHEYQAALSKQQQFDDPRRPVPLVIARNKQVMVEHIETKVKELLPRIIDEAFNGGKEDARQNYAQGAVQAAQVHKERIDNLVRLMEDKEKVIKTAEAALVEKTTRIKNLEKLVSDHEKASKILHKKLNSTEENRGERVGTTNLKDDSEEVTMRLRPCPDNGNGNGRVYDHVRTMHIQRGSVVRRIGALEQCGNENLLEILGIANPAQGVFNAQSSWLQTTGHLEQMLEHDLIDLRTGENLKEKVNFLLTDCIQSDEEPISCEELSTNMTLFLEEKWYRCIGNRFCVECKPGKYNVDELGILKDYVSKVPPSVADFLNQHGETYTHFVEVTTSLSSTFSEPEIKILPEPKPCHLCKQMSPIEAVGIGGICSNCISLYNTVSKISKHESQLRSSGLPFPKENVDGLEKALADFMPLAPKTTKRKRGRPPSSSSSSSSSSTFDVKPDSLIH